MTLFPFNMNTPYQTDEIMKIIDKITLAERIGFYASISVLFACFVFISSETAFFSMNPSDNISLVAMGLGVIIGFWIRKAFSGLAFFWLTNCQSYRLRDYEFTNTKDSIKLRMLINKEYLNDKALVDFINAIGERNFLAIEYREVSKRINQ